MRPAENGLGGVWCASVTPLAEDLGIDVGRLERHVRRLLDDGCDGVALFGSTGEGNSFTVGERSACVRELARRGMPMDRVLVGAGACAVADAVLLARTARETACAGVMLHPPFYYGNATDDGLFKWMADFVRDMGGEPTPVVLYHFPGLIGIGYSQDLIGKLREFRPDVFVGLKDSSGDLDRMSSIASSHPGFSVLAGTERLLLPLLERGGAGCLTATTNLTSRLAQRVFQERRPEDQNHLSATREALETAPFIPGIKHLLADRYDDPGWNRIRPPLTPASPEVTRRLLETLQQVRPDVSA